MPKRTAAFRGKKHKDGRSKPRPGPEIKRQDIAAAAVPLFLKHGSSSVSILQICAAADVSRSTFYRCFGDKGTLLKHVYLVSVIEPIEHFMLTSFRKRDISSEEIRFGLGEILEAIFSQADYAELVFRESSDPHSPAYKVANDAFDSLVTSLLRVASPSSNTAVDTVFLKSLLKAIEWIAHNAIEKGLTSRNKKIAKEAAWQLIRKSLDLG